MAEERTLPFHSFKFSLIEGRQPRTLMRLTAPDEGGEAGASGGEAGSTGKAGSVGETNSPDEAVLYELSVTRGSAANPLSSFTRSVPLQVALDLRDTLQQLGVFGWEESYGDTAAPGSRRWSLSIVFQKGVFSIEAKGGSDVPQGFDEMLEALYRLDFPRPAVQKTAGPEGIGRAVGDAMGALGVNSIGSMNAGDLGAYAATKGAENDYSFLKGMFGAAGANGMPGAGGMGEFNPADIDPSEMQDLFAEMQKNPQDMQKRMRQEFAHMSPDEQRNLLDMLASTGMATREWWERFLRG